MDSSARACRACDHMNAGDALVCGQCGAALDTSDGAQTNVSTLAADVDFLSPGARLSQSRYEVLSVLGQGGMGAVYKVRDHELDRVIALKVIRPELVSSAAVLRRFRQEVLIATRVTHPNVVRTFDIGESDGLRFITMELVEGETLRDRLARQGKLTPAEAVAVVRPVLEGLGAAHTRGITHRDLKPQNIMFDRDGNAIVMDFGIAHSEHHPALTHSGALVGTPEYMSPEQVRGESVDIRSDVYAVGLILYELLTGKRPFEARTSVETMYRRIHEHLRAPVELERNIPPALNAVVVRCLEQEPNDRFQSAREVLEALPATATDPAMARVAPAAGRRRLAWLAGVALAVGLAVFGYLASRPGRSIVENLAPISVLIADFQNNTGQPVFDGLLEQALAISLETAPHIGLLARDDASVLAQRVQPGTKGLPVAVARLVAVREGAGLVLSGSIDPDGERFQLRLAGVDAVSGRQTFRVSAGAATRETVLAAIGALSEAAREQLGDPTLRRGSPAVSQSRLSVSSLEAAKAYTDAQQLAFDGRLEDAGERYRTATELDPELGVAFSGWAVTEHKRGRTDEAIALWNKALSLMATMTEPQRLTTLGTYYIVVTRNFEKALETFAEQADKYPASTSARNNLAVSAFMTLDFQRASLEGGRLLKLFPSSSLYRANAALYAMYSGQFADAASHARVGIEKDPAYGMHYFPLAVSLLEKRDLSGAREAYQHMTAASLSEARESNATLGLADVSIFAGDFKGAVETLRSGIARDIAGDARSAAAVKYVALAEALLAAGDSTAAHDAARRALSMSTTDSIKVASAMVFLATGDSPAAGSIAAELSVQLQPHSRAYGSMIRAAALRQSGEHVQAIDTLRSTIDAVDLWRLRYELGLSYLDAGFFAEAFDEFERCQTRRGEATAMFLDDVPTFRYLAELPYWTARAQDGLNMRQAATGNYRAFLELRPHGGRFADDARRRLQ